MPRTDVETRSKKYRRAPIRGEFVTVRFHFSQFLHKTVRVCSEIGAEKEEQLRFGNAF